MRDPVDEQFAGLHQAGQQGLERREGVIGVPDGVGERDRELLRPANSTSRLSVK